jgi:hypothetical protein
VAFYDTSWYTNFGNGSTTGYYAVTVRPQNTAVAAGVIRRQFTAPAVGSERCFICIVAGTTANTTDATWVLTRGARTTDGTATWQECTGASAVNGDVTNTPTWAQAKAIGTPTLGAIIKRNNGASYWIASTAGTLGASEPSWPNDTAGTTQADGTTTWTCLGVIGNFTGGQAPHARLGNAGATTWFVANNTIYVGDNHAESQATAIAIAPTGTNTSVSKIVCHNHSGPYPPTANDLKTTATVSTTAAANLTLTPVGVLYVYGVTFAAAVGASAGVGFIILALGNTYCSFDNCVFKLANTAASANTIQINTTAAGVVVWNNCTVSFGHVQNYIEAGVVNFSWQNTGPILASGSAIPTGLLAASANGRLMSIVLEALDLSQLTGSLDRQTVGQEMGNWLLKDCKLNASMTIPTPLAFGQTVQLVRSDSSGTGYKSARYQYEGTETTETSITRVGGASDPTGQAQSRKIVTTANSQWLRPFRAEPYAIWNSTTGANVTVTVCGTVNAGALPNNDDIWLEVEYLGSSASPLGTMITTTKANLLAANATVASDGSTWNGTAFATFDPTTATQTTVSSDGLTATHASTNASMGVLGSSFATSGKYYFEITRGATFLSVGSDIFGAITSSGSLATISSNTQCLTISSTGNVVSNGGIQGGASPGAVAVGDVIGYALDLNARLGWVRKNNGIWNNSGTANPATGVGGVNLYPTGDYAPGAVLFGTSTAAGSAYTLNCGQSAYANAAPSGFGNFPGVWSPFKLTTTLSSPQPGQAGVLEARVRAAKPSAIFYIDPQITLTPAGGGTINVGSAYKSARYTYEGTETTETSITRVGGASDPTGQAQSRKIVTTANSQWLRPFKAEPYAIWNPTTGANVTVTVYGTINAGALPNNDDIWLEVEYLGSSSFPIGTIVTTTKANLLAANAAVASDGSTWNNTLYNTFDGVPSAGVVVSNGNLTVTHGTNNTGVGVNSTAFLVAGKWYFEVTLQGVVNGGDALGIMLSTGTFNNVVSGTNSTVVLLGGTSNVWSNNANTSMNLGSPSVGDVFGVAIDLNAKLAWFRRNNGNWNASGTANPATGTGGATIAGGAFAPVVAFVSGATTDAMTANFGQSAYSGTPPSGFANWNGWSPFKLTVTLSAPQPGMAGYLHARVRAAKPSSTFYIDPMVVLS